MVIHDQWVEEEYEKEQNSLVEIMARLIDTIMFHLPVNYEIEVTSTERQSIAKWNDRKIMQQAPKEFKHFI
ncbi:38068_t:CDS:2 [Gigaspora margarita]|uniref:38068_t:CDS:1 n=1 Tax=Gigaspora margarita TaxID=4874 RepID=A0ABN7VIV8_GIGMA|nr:38068_t:CDS:2 [Gigaspora margarita]